MLARASIDWMFEVAQRILWDFDRAEDAVQEALVAAWRDLSTLRDPERCEAWLRRVLLRVCYAEAGRRRRRDATIRALPMQDPIAADGTAAFVARDEVERGFRRLPPDQRAILVLHHYLGLAPDEIAETLEIPAGTARSRLHYAHAAMRAALEADARRELVGGVRP